MDNAVGSKKTNFCNLITTRQQGVQSMKTKENETRQFLFHYVLSRRDEEDQEKFLIFVAKDSSEAIDKINHLQHELCCQRGFRCARGRLFELSAATLVGEY